MKSLKNDEVALALLRLLQIALNGSIPQKVGKVEWSQVMQLAQSQGVRALVYEALELLKANGEASVGFPEKMQLMQCYAQTAFVEKMYA